MPKGNINFELELGRIPRILNILAAEEGTQLLNVAARLSSLSTNTQVRDLQQTLESIDAISQQLRQYLKMMGEIDQLLNSTVLPTAVPEEPIAAAEPAEEAVSEDVFQSIKDLKDKLGEVQDFTKFLESATTNLPSDDGGTDDSKEG